MTARTFTADDIAAAKAWPFEEAKKLADRLKRIGHEGVVVFVTGYGPSGPPHIGTIRRGRAHDDGAARVRIDDRPQDATHLVL